MGINDRKGIMDRQRGRKDVIVTDEGLGVMIDRKNQQLSQCLLSSSYAEDSR